jgi:hypothetical protein
MRMNTQSHYESFQTIITFVQSLEWGGEMGGVRVGCSCCDAGCPDLTRADFSMYANRLLHQ